MPDLYTLWWLSRLALTAAVIVCAVALAVIALARLDDWRRRTHQPGGDLADAAYDDAVDLFAEDLHPDAAAWRAIVADLADVDQVMHRTIARRRPPIIPNPRTGDDL